MVAVSLAVGLTTISASILAFLGSRRMENLTGSSYFVSWLVVALFLSCWLFAVTVNVVMSGHDVHTPLCDVSIFVCSTLYAGSKLIMYLFFVEKLRIIVGVRVPRTKSKLYIFSLALMSPYAVVFVLMLMYGIGESINGECHIGLEAEASIPLVAYDTVFSTYQTVVFMGALALQSRTASASDQGATYRKGARRTLISSVVCLISSFSNILLIALFQAQRGYMCFGGCVIDLTVNSLAIYWLTSSRKRRSKHPTTEAWKSQDNGTVLASSNARPGAADATAARSTASPEAPAVRITVLPKSGPSSALPQVWGSSGGAAPLAAPPAVDGLYVVTRSQAPVPRENQVAPADSTAS